MGGERISTPIPRYAPSFDETFFSNAFQHNETSSKPIPGRTTKTSLSKSKQRAMLDEMSFESIDTLSNETETSTTEDRDNSDEEADEHSRFVLTSSSDDEDEMSEDMPLKIKKPNNTTNMVKTDPSNGAQSTMSHFTYSAPQQNIISYQPAPIDYQSVMHVSNVYQPANVTRKTNTARLATSGPQHIQTQITTSQNNINARVLSWSGTEPPPSQTNTYPRVRSWAGEELNTSLSPSKKTNAPPPPAALFNNPLKKIYFNKDFLEGECGFSYSSIQQHEQKEIQLEKQQMKQLKKETGERQEALLNQIIVEQQQQSTAYEVIESKANVSDLILVQDENQQKEPKKSKKASEYPKEHIRHTSRQSSPWNEYKSAFSLVRVIASQWSWGEITLGLEYYARNQAQKLRNFKKFIAEAQQSRIDDSDVEIWRRYAQLTYSVFRDGLEDLQRTLGLKPQNVIAFDKTQQTMRPAYFICLDQVTESVLVIFRGTKTFSDLITDLHCSSIVHRNGYCHKGILIAAQWFNNNRFIKQILHRTLELYPNYKLRLLGHSLGGGTAAILSTFWREGEFPHVRSYAFACPPVLSQSLAEECADYVTSFVNGDDFVTRLSMTAIEKLRKDVSKYPWKEEMMRDIQNSAIVKFASGVKNYASGIFSKGVGLIRSGAAYYTGSTSTATDISSINSEKNVITRVTNTTESEILSHNRKSQMIENQIDKIYPTIQHNDDKELNEITFIEGDSPNTIVQVQYQTTNTSSDMDNIKYDTQKRNLKDKKPEVPEKNAHFIINAYENLVVGLFPAGKIYQIRNIDGTVYIKRAKQEEYTKIILSETWKEDHRMIHYQNNLLCYATARELSVKESELQEVTTPTGSDFVHLSVNKK